MDSDNQLKAGDTVVWRNFFGKQWKGQIDEVEPEGCVIKSRKWGMVYVVFDLVLSVNGNSFFKRSTK